MPRPGLNVTPMKSARWLSETWARRDQLYAVRRIRGVRTPTTDTEQAAIIAWRRGEAEALTGLDRSVALSILSRWAPPLVMA